MNKSYQKLLSANDVGETKSHQAGICVPKADKKLLSFFPCLDLEKFNPDAWIICEDKDGELWQMRYIYYNGKTLGLNTRNEYRITHIANFLYKWKANSGDLMVFTAKSKAGMYDIRINKKGLFTGVETASNSDVIVLRGWSRVH